MSFPVGHKITAAERRAYTDGKGEKVSFNTPDGKGDW
jgi:hypothetical protein